MWQNRDNLTHFLDRALKAGFVFIPVGLFWEKNLQGKKKKKRETEMVNS